MPTAGSLAPPDLPGYTFLRHLGSGGFSDVHLYERHMPRRVVAVKVLRDHAVDDQARRRFSDEANVMASLASHPSIVTIYDAAIAEDGRPYLVMEYYPEENLRERSLRERMRVETVLSYGIQIACAVETAHRAHILHRDIKPANILVSQVGTPALTDFGIAATLAEASLGQDEDGGLSVPWSPPEVLASGAASDTRSDVWSIGATMYTLLTGRSPFELPGGPNELADLMRRIEGEPPQPLRRPDVPDSFERVLQQALAKRPAARPPSALALAQALQGVERELRLPVTPLVLMSPATWDGAASGATAAASASGGSRSADPDPDEEATRVVNVARTVADVQGPPAARQGTGGAVDNLTVDRASLFPGHPSAFPDHPSAFPDHPPAEGGDDARTRLRESGLSGVRTVSPDSLAPRAGWPGGPATRSAPEPVEPTMRRPATVTEEAGPASPSRLGGALWAVVAVVVIALVVAVGTLAHSLSGSSSSTTTTTGPSIALTQNAVVAGPPEVTGLVLKVTGHGTVTVSWDRPDQAPAWYMWQRVDGNAPDHHEHATTKAETAAARFVLKGLGVGEKPCIDIQSNNGNAATSQVVHACLTEPVR